MAQQQWVIDTKGGKKKALFDDESEASSSEADQEDGGVTLGGGPSTELKINEEYARRFEHNKKREELHRLEEKYKSKAKGGEGANEDEDEESSEDETEDDDAFLVTEDLDAEISATLQAIKNKDPRIYDKNAVFYKPFDPEAEPAKETKEKPMTLRDYHRERYMKGDVGADFDDEADKPKTYTQEQGDLKKSLLDEINAQAAADSEEWSDDDAFLKPIERKEEQKSATTNGMHPSRAANIKLTEVDVANADKNPEEFLTKFMGSKAWTTTGSKWEAFESDDGEDLDDDLADEFEHAYNMRFEDPTKSNEVLKTYSRNAAAARSARKEELTGRKKQRQLEKEKKEAEKQQREQERARLRRLKVEEASDKLQKIKAAAGVSGKKLSDEEWLKFLDDAWEDDKWEEEMKKRFGEDYYAEGEDDLLSMDEEEEDEESSSSKKKKPKKPKWDDDIDIKDIIPDFDDEAQPKITLSDEEQEGAPLDGMDVDEEEEEEDDRPAKKRKTTKDIKNEKIAAKRQARQELAKLEALVDAKMEIENPRVLSKSEQKTAGFRYRETSPNTFGMTPRDILLAPSDAVLNEFAGLKKLATFREEEKKRKDKKKLGKKARLRQWRRDTFGKEYERMGPTFGFDFKTDEAGTAIAAAQAEAQARAQAEQQKQQQQQEASGIVEGERKKKRKRSKKNKNKTDGEGEGAEVEAES
ncbi:KRI1-like family-domain-containing protein [Diplogelasinospora grovesii]|uniref:KRI1-like family-domain-containing protein n=1 Tax=Diplogelasinospora grovesii TaxID=303347 RepID=A0AAN6NAX1_9PEZI|nr:KRI1-like family-domain-containing protein [Diplogelasinospora grovesii]